MIADALLTEDKDSITDPRARMFRDFADQPGKDRLALAACMRAMTAAFAASRFCKRFVKPILVVCGDQDNRRGAARPPCRHISPRLCRNRARPRPHVGGGRASHPPGRAWIS